MLMLEWGEGETKRLAVEPQGREEIEEVGMKKNWKYLKVLR